MNNLEKMARLFEERNNYYYLPAAQGKVISTSPLKVQFGDSIIIEEEDLVVGRLHAEGFTVEYTDNNGTSTVTKAIVIKDQLQVDDKVILIPDNEFKTWYLMAKVGSLI